MKRRQFLKSVFGVIGGLVVLPSVVKAESKQRWLLGGQRVGKSIVFVHGTTKDFIEVGQPVKDPRLAVFKDCIPMLKEIPHYKICEPPEWPECV